MERQWIKDKDGQEFVADVNELRKNLKKANIEIPEIVIPENDQEIFHEEEEDITNGDHCVKCGKKLIGKPNGFF